MWSTSIKYLSVLNIQHFSLDERERERERERGREREGEGEGEGDGDMER